MNPNRCESAAGFLVSQGPPLTCPLCRRRHPIAVGQIKIGDSFDCGCGYTIHFTETLLNGLREPVKDLRQAIQSLQSASFERR